jgi:uncharacterized protein DUF4236/tetratricopeptide repeat protein
MPSYFRLWRRKQIVPGVRLNLSKSGVSLSLGPRGAHYTVGPRGTRATVGLPGSGLYYTTYSGHHARQAADRHARPALNRAVSAPVTPAKPRQTEPMLPGAKIGWGVALGGAGILFIFLAWPLGLLLLLIGGAFLAVGYSQRTQPKWRIRGLIRKAHDNPQTAAALLDQALNLDPQNPEALAASAEHSFRSSDWAKASELYERYIGKSPDDWQAEAHLGCSYLNAGDQDRAIPHLQKARAVASPTEQSQISLTNAVSLAFLKKGDGGQTLEILKTLPLQRHTLDATLQEGLFLRAVAHYQLHQTSNAVTDLDRLYALNPNYPDLQDAKDKMKSGTFALGDVQVSVDPR